MAIETLEFKPMSRTEYRATEEDSFVRREYIQGRVADKPDDNSDHSQLSGRLLAILDTQLYGTGYRPVSGQLRIRASEADADFYSDGAICPEMPDFEDEERRVLLNPIVVFQIYSPTTESFDRVEKYLAYTKIPTVSDYILIDQGRVLVEHHHRRSEGWLAKFLMEREDTLVIPDVPVSFRIGELYRDLDVPSGLSLVKS